VFLTEVPITKLFVCVVVCVCALIVCVFITAGPSTNLFAWGGGGIWDWRTCATRDDEPRPVWTGLPIMSPTTMGGGVPEGRVYGRRLAFVSVRTIKRLHHRTSERGGEGDCVKEGGGGEGKCERERALERLRYYSPGH
jgi:hypothetical protein